ncbi:MAG TPA: large-conductance mechanosensitive channel protein MscL [Patescibacteria group bacterium]|nr:large-conductance mechanosensitive channel protein MscL [Patescibacteria group bacterium]
MGMISEFKAFAMRGNVVDMAVGVVIGAAFGKIVSALVDKMIMPVVGFATSGKNFGDLVWTMGSNPDGTPAVSIGYGAFLQSTLDFVIVAFVLFLVIKAMNKMKKAEDAAPAAPPAPSEQEKLLAEIRDLLKQR